jgi:hypothetical protein
VTIATQREEVLMKSNTTGWIARTIFSTLVIVASWVVGAGPCRAQATASPDRLYALGSNEADAIGGTAPASGQPPAPGAGAAPTAAPADDSDWHFILSPYLWLPGVHGIIGREDLNANVSASPGDLLSHFRFGLMGTFETDYKRVVVPLDIMWVRLGDNKAVPSDLDEISANVKASEFILTSKIGYRLIDSKMIKIDGLTGFRYWHIGQSLNFTPSEEGLNFSSSQNWVDPLVGGRILVNLSPKIEATIGGDVGGWGTGSQLDYQAGGVLGYRIKPALALQVGYRYLYVNYRTSAIFDVATSGVLVGVSIILK